ncbi:IdeS/Mac family cysteine endopeptidase [Mycoplasma bradburyae]|uniref:IdeS/Mac family cysteine endopeptidase n=1 Tax=Mycoplasma bradburyae TaxID=2963128 RepID=UPI00233FC9AA|nr:IdeS/Mac family cysteine endopeptidase [Mycoplasma bradburyae]MDC4184280.1 IdeS/Mac family cysteine endopeptidase [Mycoplasma bradburyae]
MNIKKSKLLFSLFGTLITPAALLTSCKNYSNDVNYQLEKQTLSLILDDQEVELSKYDQPKYNVIVVELREAFNQAKQIYNNDQSTISDLRRAIGILEKAITKALTDKRSIDSNNSDHQNGTSENGSSSGDNNSSNEVSNNANLDSNNSNNNSSLGSTTLDNSNQDTNTNSFNNNNNNNQDNALSSEDNLKLFNDLTKDLMNIDKTQDDQVLDSSYDINTALKKWNSLPSEVKSSLASIKAKLDQLKARLNELEKNLPDFDNKYRDVLTKPSYTNEDEIKVITALAEYETFSAEKKQEFLSKKQKLDKIKDDIYKQRINQGVFYSDSRSAQWFKQDNYNVLNLTLDTVQASDYRAISEAKKTIDKLLPSIKEILAKEHTLINNLWTKVQQLRDAQPTSVYGGSSTNSQPREEESITYIPRAENSEYRDPKQFDFANKTMFVYGVNAPGFKNDPEKKWIVRNDVARLPYDKKYGWYDVNKIALVEDQYRDFNLCWAASASNLLHWWINNNKQYIDAYFKLNSTSEWSKSVPTYYPERQSIQNDNKEGRSQIFQRFSDAWSDRGGFINDGINWFVSGWKPRSSGLLVDIDENKGGYFKDVFTPKPNRETRGRSNDVTEDYNGLSFNRFNDVLKDAFLNKKAVGFSYPGHAMSIWGAEFDANGNVDYIYFCNNNYGDQEEDLNGGSLIRAKVVPISTYAVGYYTDSFYANKPKSIKSFTVLPLYQDTWKQYLAKHKS